RRVVFMNQRDNAEFGREDAQKLEITSYWVDRERHVKGFTIVKYAIPAGCTAAYFPEANPLVPLGSHARRSFTPTSKCIVVSVEKSKEN
ncbi:MAG: hypothetical protein QUS14_03665, partial [Pyrinomonadaceae bacterium]|nr:hypothetical protein [Pyrinomonadaceae bacterium]